MYLHVPDLGVKVKDDSFRWIVFRFFFFGSFVRSKLVALDG